MAEKKNFLFVDIEEVKIPCSGCFWGGVGCVIGGIGIGAAIFAT